MYSHRPCPVIASAEFSTVECHFRVGPLIDLLLFNVVAPSLFFLIPWRRIREPFVSALRVAGRDNRNYARQQSEYEYESNVLDEERIRQIERAERKNWSIEVNGDGRVVVSFRGIN